MILVRVGKRWLNLDYLVMAEEWCQEQADPAWGPGSLRITLVAGRMFDLPPGEAGTVRRRLESLLAESPGAPPPGGTVTILDPATGAPVADPAPRKKRRR